MSARGSIRKVVVAGGGITAWSAAAALKRRIPSLEVELIETPAASDALADHIISTLPSICGFHHDIGLAEADTITGAASSLRVGTLIEGWADHQPDYVHGYGPCGAPVRGVPFHQLWLRDSSAHALPPFHEFSPAAQLARSGTQAHIGFGQFGLQLTLNRYHAMIRAYALHLGVQSRKVAVTGVELRPQSGFIDAAVLSNGGRATGDLFVDCTGPASSLHKTMESPFLDWSGWLPCDRVLLQEAEPEPTAVSIDRVTALANGWRWAASSPKKALRGIVYSSAHARGDDAPRELAKAHEPIAIHQGRRRDFWVRNCVAIGDAAVVVEPLEWTNLHLAQSQIDRLVAMMPGTDCAAVEIAQYNSECTAEADRVRDFLCLHYVCSQRTEPFWQDAAAIVPPSSLEHTLSLFQERGRLPYYQEETFSRDSWLTVLIGQGVRPRRVDPLADLVPAEEAAQTFIAMRQSLQSFTLPAAATLPELNPFGIR